ncbi:MAG: response regulator [Anaerolineales bacterium]|nr:response regulator [Anaerolineales bacterium]
MRARILVIDDEDYIRRLVGYVLEQAGYDVVLASSAQEGLKLLREAHPDAVTLDLMMPGESGLELLHAKHVDPSIRDIPSLILTAVGIQADLDQARELGATAMLNKPFSRQQLVDSVRSVLGG